MTNPGDALERRSFLRHAVLAGGAVLAGVPILGCASSPPRPPGPAPAGRPARSGSAAKSVLLAYFSRAGENYHYGGRRNLRVGNTEVLAQMISRRIGCDVHRIEPADPYPGDYEETVARNVREQDAGARPAIAGPLPSIDRYDTVLVGSPIWNVRAPMIMSTFTEGLDLRGKTVVPFTTHAMSGLGTTARDYAATCPGATIADGLAVRGEEVNDAGAAVEAWLRHLRLLAAPPGAPPVS
ncbi:Flavodoxin [Nonomuraea solani]|uniref:Flavodoxin n=1 Tax=Nonomuraea solani TaxID=1144553 RepID=A0A1H6F1B4_9ACTN|nr:flavodoxin [Nonomuraea solani]SEH03151.1 Flavodoxin [Nonomuraea solani]